jgi:hypothetical protein
MQEVPVKAQITETFVLPNLTVANRDGSANQEGLECLSSAILTRMANQFIKPKALDKIIRASGGLMRTLVRMTQRSAVNAIAAGNDAISIENAEAAIGEERADFIAGLRRDDYPVLRARHQDKQLSGDQIISSLLCPGVLLEYTNGAPWCDVHPVLLPLVLAHA